MLKLFPVQACVGVRGQVDNGFDHEQGVGVEHRDGGEPVQQLVIVERQQVEAHW